MSSHVRDPHILQAELKRKAQESFEKFSLAGSAFSVMEDKVNQIGDRSASHEIHLDDSQARVYELVNGSHEPFLVTQERMRQVNETSRRLAS